MSLFVLQSSGSQFPARKAEQRERRPTPPPEPPPRPPTPGPGPGALAPEPPSLPLTCSGELDCPELLLPHYDLGAEQWVELVGVLPPHLLLPQQKVVLEPLPGLPAPASPDQRVRIQRVPQVLVFGTAATALKVGGGTRGGRGRVPLAPACARPLRPWTPPQASQSWGPTFDSLPKASSRSQAPPHRGVGYVTPAPKALWEVPSSILQTGPHSRTLSLPLNPGLDFPVPPQHTRGQSLVQTPSMRPCLWFQALALATALSRWLALPLGSSFHTHSRTSLGSPLYVPPQAPPLLSPVEQSPSF